MSDLPLWVFLPLLIGLPVGTLVSMWSTLRSKGPRDALGNKTSR